MKNKFTLTTIILTACMVLAMASCKKKGVKTVAVDTQFALALYNNTLSLKDVIHQMDASTQSWLRVRNDSIFAYYADTIKDVIKASDFLSNIDDVDFNTVTDFTLPSVSAQSEKDTTLSVDRFATFPFHYDGFIIDEVLLRSGVLAFGFNVTPSIPMLKQIVVFSDQLQMTDGNRFEVTFNYPGNSECEVDLAGCSFVPEDDTVAFSAKIVFHYDPSIGFQGGDYSCRLTGGLTDVRFNTVYGIVTKPIDSIFEMHNNIDFGINHVSGSFLLPIPTIEMKYKNTFGLSAHGDINTFEFRTADGQTVNLLADDYVEITVEPTEGEYYSTPITGFVEQIDALSNFTRLDFHGEITMAEADQPFTISDTSSIDVIGSVEMPFEFKLSDVRYRDSLDVNFSGSNNEIDKIDNYFDELDFIVQYNSKIKIDMDMQVYFMRNNLLLDSLFNNTQLLEYSINDEIKEIDVEPFTGERLKHIMRANKMVIDMGWQTDEISSDPIMMMDTDQLLLRLKLHTKTSEIDLDDIL